MPPYLLIVEQVLLLSVASVELQVTVCPAAEVEASCMVNPPAPAVLVSFVMEAVKAPREPVTMLSARAPAPRDAGISQAREFLRVEVFEAAMSQNFL